jgi:hypothetical protein
MFLKRVSHPLHSFPTLLPLSLAARDVCRQFRKANPVSRRFNRFLIGHRLALLGIALLNAGRHSVKKLSAFFAFIED